MNYIESKENPKMKLLRKLSERKHRQSEGLTVIEGLRSVEQLLETDAGIRFVVLSEDQSARYDALSRLIASDQIFVVKRSIFAHVADTVHAQGILAVVEIPVPDRSALLSGQLSRLLLVDRVQDPGNLGTLIRSADAAGFDAVLYTSGTVEPFAPKVNRASMGANLYVPLFSVSEEELSTLTQRYRMYATVLRDGSVPYNEVDYASGYMLAVGNEANGLSDARMAQAAQCIHIPMFGHQESLNVAIAGSVVMFKSIEK